MGQQTQDEVRCFGSFSMLMLDELVISKFFTIPVEGKSRHRIAEHLVFLFVNALV